MEGKLEFNVFKTHEVDPTVILGILFGIVAVIGICAYGSYLHQRYQRFREFNDEMHALGLDSKQEDTLASLVKRYRMDKPLEVLLSKQVFDEMASREMVRILGTHASVDVKEKYIHELYEIRKRTYGKPQNPQYIGELTM